MTGLLVVAATPIGSAEDASPRLRRALAEADVVAAEDTRRLRRLCADLGVAPRGRVVSYFEGNEQQRAEELVADVAGGSQVLLVSDAGVPTISDPGYRLVSACVAAGLPVTAIPGPSAVLTALAVSGLPAGRFCFEGFLPRRAGERQRTLAAVRDERRTMVFFEAPHRLAATLADLVAEFGPERPGAVCRELTKTYEEVRRASLAELADWATAGEVLGEVTLVVAGRPAPSGPPEGAALQALVDDVRRRVASGVRLKEAVAEVAAPAGVAKRLLYEASLPPRPPSS